MKQRKIWLLPLLSAGLFFVTACGGAGASGTLPGSEAPSASASLGGAGQAPKQTDTVYRGEVVSTGENEFTVAQMPGYDYGQAEILFNTDGKTEFIFGNTEENTSAQELKLTEGAFVQVEYDGRLTRSLPPQATAIRVRIVAPQSEGIVVSGTVQMVEKSEDGYRLELLPFGAQASSSPADTGSLVVLNLPLSALENISEAELVEGAEVSAVTMGIATASLPPQMPVLALLPYTG